MKRLMYAVLTTCLLLGVVAAQTKTSTKKSATKAAPTAASAKATDSGSSHVKAYTPDQIKWGPAPNMLPAGAQLAVLEGDPMKSGPFTMRLKMPNGYRIPPHSHMHPEHVTVISGSIRVGMGDKFDENAMTSFGAGSFAVIDPGTHHYAMAKNDMMFKGKDTVIQLHGEGPWGIQYVNPGDDPRNKK
jgi:mannose-6-phosphate isomerase-like protein (cupin superfamily)